VSGPPEDDAMDDDLAKRYRSASAQDVSRPGPAVRNAILARARIVAKENSHPDSAPASVADVREAANDSRWRIKAVAAIAVACIASLVAVHLRDGPIRQPEPLSPSAGEPNGRTAPAATEGLARSPAPAADIPPSASARRADEVERHRADSRPAQSASTSTPPSAKATARTDERDAGGPQPAPEATANQTSSTSRAERATENTGADVGALKEVPRAAPPPMASRESRAGVGAQSSPLVDAAAAGDLAQVDRLLRAGVSTEQVDALGRTALLVATQHARIDVIRRLLGAGASVNAVAKNGDTPLALAQRQGPAEVLKLLQGSADSN
jgi:Ankyrin repeats (3 copies)